MVQQVVVFLVLLFPAAAFAEESCGPQNYDADTTPNFECPSPGEADLVPNLRPPLAIAVREGQTVVSAWEGALVHRDQLILVGLRLQALRRLRWLDRFVGRARLEVEDTYRAELRQADAEFCDSRVQHYQEVALAAEQTSSRASAWYRSFGFGLAVGFLVSGLLVALAVYLGLSL
jgi:hypothetical protein